MLLEPIDEDGASVALPKRKAKARGLFAWGRTQPGRNSLIMTWAEFLFVFIAMPLIAIASHATQGIPLVMGAMLASTAALLSMTRSFHWSDLLPIDMLSEWRIALKSLAIFSGTSFIVTLLFFPYRLFSPAGDAYVMLLAFPLVTALPLELVYRALFFRRFGLLFHNELGAIVAGAIVNALVYFMLSGGGEAAAVFGACVGALLGWVYLRTGQFVLSVLLHWCAALCVWLIGPGLVFAN